MKKYFAIVFWGFVLLIFFISKFHFGFSYEQIALALYNIFSKTGGIGVFLFIIIYGLRPLVFFPASFMSLMGGTLYGPIFGVLYVLIGSNLGGQVGFFLGQILGNNIFSKKLDGRFLQYFTQNVQKHQFLTVLIARMLFMPYDPVSYLSGILKVDWKYYSVATLFGTLPATLVFVLAGASFYKQDFTSFTDIFYNINTSLLYFAAGIFIISVIISKILRKKFIS